MLRGTRENISFLASISNCAGVMALCFLLLATTVVVLPQNLHSSPLQPAYAQQVEEEEGEEGTTDTGTGEEGEEGTTDTGTGEEGEEGTTTTEPMTAEIISNYTADVDHVAPETISFAADASGGTGPYTVNWNFGDDSEESDEQTVSHTFTEAGNYTVTLTATDSTGETATDTLEITVEESSEEPATDEEPLATDEEPLATDEEPLATESLAAEITSNSTSGNAPATFSFDANASGGTGPYTVNWNFGDDSEESDEESVVHTFTEADNYTVTLTVTDSEDQTATDTLEITVEESSEEPATDEEPLATESLAAEITSNSTSGNAPATFSFDANASGGTGPYTVNWNFGDDSEESDEESVVHTFTEADNYTVTLTATDSTGETATDTLEITVEESPTDEEPVPLSEGGTDKWGIKELYPTASNGPTWYIREVEDPTTDSLFYYGIYEGTTIKSIGTGVWQVDARSGTQEHGIRMHVDSPTGKWKNTEMTGYFNIHSGDDQFTMIARHGTSYHDNGGCEAYGYYALTAVDGQVFFKKKLYHFNNGYTKRLAQVNALGDIHDEWVGMKFAVYDLPNGDVKLELWIDKGDMTNKWQKETELIDKGNLAVTGGDDCGRDATDKIDSGTRVSFRADNSLFDFKKLSVREIQEGSTPASTTEDTTTEDTTPASTTEDTTTEDTTPASTTEDTTTEDTTPEEDLSTEDLIPSGLRSWLSY
jgi:PKD repeat protein